MHHSGNPNDFDFLVGSWTTRQHRLKERLTGCTEWDQFEATLAMQKLPGGVANFDTLVAPAWRPGWVGMSLRVFNPATEQWSIFWFTNEGGGLDARTGQLEPPVVGGFNGSEGVFEADDQLRGQPIRVRYRWSLANPHEPRWEQSFSPDGGRSWELNWWMTFARLPE